MDQHQVTGGGQIGEDAVLRHPGHPVGKAQQRAYQGFLQVSLKADQFPPGIFHLEQGNTVGLRLGQQPTLRWIWAQNPIPQPMGGPRLLCPLIGLPRSVGKRGTQGGGILF